MNRPLPAGPAQTVERLDGRPLSERYGSAPGDLESLVRWLVVLEMFSLVTLPLVLTAGRGLADGGLLLVKPFGVLLVAWASWFLASVTPLAFGWWSTGVALAVLAGLSAIIVLRNRHVFMPASRRRWKLILAAEAAFLVPFLIFAGIRALNPDLWHFQRSGEKFIEMAHLSAIANASSFPPPDPWFAGSTINYYYFGSVEAATVLRSAGVLPEVAFNLAIASLAGFIFSAALSAGWSLARWWQPSLARPWLAGIAAAILITFAGNLDVPIQLGASLAANGQPGIAAGMPVAEGAARLADGTLRWLSGGPGPAFDYWNSSRMMPEQNAITEFPFFSLLFADLHAHVIALPLTIVAFALALSVAGGAGWPSLIALGFIVGALRATNAWDYPAYLLVAFCAATISAPRRTVASWLAIVSGRVALIFLVGYAAFLPFILSFQQYYTELVASTDTSPLRQFLAMFGVILMPLVTVAVVKLCRLGIGRWWTLGAALAAIVVASMLGVGTIAFAAFMLAGAVVLGIGYAIRCRSHAPEMFMCAAGALCFGLVIAVDVVNVAGTEGRQNMVFKFYYQIWTMLSLLSAVTVWALLNRGAVWLGRWFRPWAAAYAVLAAIALLYPLIATPQRIAERFQPMPPTLNGLAFMQLAVYHDPKGDIPLREDMEAIRWLREHALSDGVLMEGRTPPARWGARMSVYTGLADVIGWDRHERQERVSAREAVDARAADVDLFYSTPEPAEAAAILRRYRVRYVIVGTLERLFYPARGIAKISAMPNLEPVFTGTGTTIYQVADYG